MQLVSNLESTLSQALTSVAGTSDEIGKLARRFTDHVQALDQFAAIAERHAVPLAVEVDLDLDAAREGKVNEYLNAHTGQMEQSLRKAVAESTEAGFSQYLKESNAPIKGIALQEPLALTDREVKVKVEYVFQDRNEVQWMYLEKSGNSWRIARVDTAERIQTLVPYGTPVR